MKKVRIMLAAIVVLGSVGGALALKAKTFGGATYCTSDQGTTGDLCPTLLQNATFKTPAAIPYRRIFNTNCANITCTALGTPGV